MQEIIACLGDKKANFASGSVLFLNKVGPCWEAALQVVNLWMSLEGHTNGWMMCRCGLKKKKETTNPNPQTIFLPRSEHLFLSPSASSHAPPCAPGDGNIFGGFGSYPGGFCMGCAPSVYLQLWVCISFALVLFSLVLGGVFKWFPICKYSDSVP